MKALEISLSAKNAKDAKKSGLDFYVLSVLGGQEVFADFLQKFQTELQA